MTQQPFSRPGAIDLSALKRPAQSAPGAAAPGAPGATAGGAGGQATGAYTVEVDEQSFQSVLESSMTAPVVLVFYSPGRSPESADLARNVSTVAEEYDGRFLAGLVDIDASPQIAQAMQIQQVPLMYVLLDGRPVTQPIPSAPPIDELRAFFNQLGQQLTAQGIGGRHKPRTVEAPEGEEPVSDPRFAAADEALASGDVDTAVAEYEKLVAANPADTEAAAGLARAQLLKRTQGVDLNAARAAAAANPDDVEAQILVADLDLLGGHVEDAFARLVELVRRASGDERNAVREHLVALFAAVGNDDPRVLKGRQALANALF
ncbi:tetratricopeptide repeat protein [Nocardioides sp. DS6]|uniref:Tetratricopeptide repeat protein n=1 Tax=Nocardioides eburneus TaxID=3231482 RepID=A0ABV3T3H7_9ACTN